MEVVKPLLGGGVRSPPDDATLASAIETWSIDTVINYLSRDPSLASSKDWQDAFREQHIDGQMLLTLSDEVLRDVLHIESWGIRGKIVSSIQQLRQEASEEKAAQRIDPGVTPGGPQSYDAVRSRKSTGAGMFLDPFRDLFVYGWGDDLRDQDTTILLPFPAFLNGRDLIDYFAAISAVGAALACAAVISLLQTSFDYVIDWHRLLNLAYLGLVATKIFQIVKTLKLFRGAASLVRSAIVTQALLYGSQITFYFSVVFITIAIIREKWEGEHQLPEKRARHLTARAWALFLVEITTLVASIFYVAGAGYYLNREMIVDSQVPLILFNNAVFQRMRAQIAIGVIGIVSAVVSWFSSAERLLGHIPLAMSLVGYWCLYIADLSNQADLYWRLEMQSLPQYVVLESLPNMFVLIILVFVILFGSVNQKFEGENEKNLEDLSKAASDVV